MAEQLVGVGAPDHVGVHRQHRLAAEMPLQDQVAQQGDTVDRVVGQGFQVGEVAHQRPHHARDVLDVDPVGLPVGDELRRDALEALGDQHVERLRQAHVGQRLEGVVEGVGLAQGLEVVDDQDDGALHRAAACGES